jgi:hypothetical protein
LVGGELRREGGICRWRAGQRTSMGEAGFSNSVAILGRCKEEEERTDRRSPHVGERKREKALLLECTIPKTRHLLAIVPRQLGLSGLCGGGGSLRGRWADTCGLGGWAGFQ